MTRKEYTEEARPLIELVMAFILYLRFGELNQEKSPYAWFPIAKMFTTEFEKHFKFDDD